MGSVIEERLDHVEVETASINRRLDRRRHWWVTLGLTGITMGLAAIGGSYLAAQSVVREARAREAQACVQRNEFRAGNRTEIDQFLPLIRAQNPNSPAIPVLENLRNTTFASVDC